MIYHDICEGCGNIYIAFILWSRVDCLMHKFRVPSLANCLVGYDGNALKPQSFIKKVMNLKEFFRGMSTVTELWMNN